MANITMHREDVSTTCRPVSQCLQPSVIKQNASIALGRPNSTQGWNCLFIISIILGLWKMALMIGCKIEEVFFFFPKCVLMMCCLMECHSNPFQNAGNSALYLCFVSMIGGRDEWRILLWRDLAWGHLSPMICKRNTVQDACTATCRIKQLNACSRYQQTIWILCLQLEKKGFDWVMLFVYASVLVESTYNKLSWLLTKFSSCT